MLRRETSEEMQLSEYVPRDGYIHDLHAISQILNDNWLETVEYITYISWDGGGVVNDISDIKSRKPSL